MSIASLLDVYKKPNKNKIKQKPSLVNLQEEQKLFEGDVKQSFIQNSFLRKN